MLLLKFSSNATVDVCSDENLYLLVGIKRSDTFTNSPNFVSNHFVISNVHLFMSWFSITVPPQHEMHMLRPDILTVIAESDVFARKRLREFLENEDGIQLVAECQNGAQAIEAVKNHRPDLLVLDTSFADMNGLAVLGKLPSKDAPVVIFTSSRKQDAFRAFQARAMDYLLKPFDPERVHIAIERVRAEMLKTFSSPDSVSSSEPELQGRDRKRLVVKTEGRVLILETSEIDWLEAAGNYVRLHTGSRAHMFRERISRITSRLDPARFIRIHRSIIVNIDRIKELQPCNSGEYMVILKNGRELSCSRTYRTRLQQAISSY